jgi:outer membrane cobalamin receptor
MDKTIINLKQVGLLIALLVFSFSGFSQSSFAISGKVYSNESGEPLPFANVIIKDTYIGTTCNSNGQFVLKTTDGIVDISCSFIGYQTLSISLDLKKDTNINFALSLTSTELNEITLSESKPLMKSAVGEVFLTKKMVESIPTMVGEPDVIKSLQLLPGISGGHEGSSGLYVRGGGPDQNLILLDGVPVYNISHLFGFVSNFNGLAISGARIIKGGFPAQYGGRLSSILSIELREGNKYKWCQDISVSPLASNFLIEGPVKKGKSSMFISARFSYFNWFLGLVNTFSNGNSRSNYDFGDWNFRYTSKLNSNNHISLSVYTGRDNLLQGFSQTINDKTYEDVDKLNWGNLTSAIRWTHTSKSNVISEVLAYYTQYSNQITTQSFDIDSSNVTELNQELTSGLQEIGIKNHNIWQINENHQLNFGVKLARQTFNPGSKQFSYAIEGKGDSTFTETAKYASLNNSIYIEDRFQISPQLMLSYGLHFSQFSHQQKSYYKLQPRVNLTYYINENWLFKASYSEMLQPLHLLSNFGTGLPTNLWVSATNKVKPSTAEQYSLGTSINIKDSKYKIDIDIYSKTMSDLITFENGFNFLKLGNWEDQIIQGGDGIAYGAEFLLTKCFGRLSGWLGYTYSHTYRQFDEINDGNRYPYQFDRRHDISIVANFKLKEHIQINAAWVFGTGNAMTLEDQVFAYGGKGTFHSNLLQSGTVHNPGPRNWFRMESMHRLDVGVAFTKEKPNGKRIINVGLYNAYGNNNPYYYKFIKKDNKTLGLFKVALMPIIPSISWRRNF